MKASGFVPAEESAAGALPVGALRRRIAWTCAFSSLATLGVLLASAAAMASPPARNEANERDCAADEELAGCDETPSEDEYEEVEDWRLPQDYEFDPEYQLAEDIRGFRWGCDEEVENAGSDRRPTREEGHHLESEIAALEGVDHQHLRGDLVDAYASCGYLEDAKRLFAAAFAIDALQDPASRVEEWETKRAVKLLLSMGDETYAAKVEQAGWARAARATPLRAAEIIVEDLQAREASGLSMAPEARAERIARAAGYVDQAALDDHRSRTRALAIARRIARLALSQGLHQVAEATAQRVQRIAGELESATLEVARAYVEKRGHLAAVTDDRWAYVSEGSAKQEDALAAGVAEDLLLGALEGTGSAEAADAPRASKSKRGGKKGKASKAGGNKKKRQAEASSNDQGYSPGGINPDIDPKLLDALLGGSEFYADPNETPEQRDARHRANREEDERGAATYGLAAAAAAYYELGTLSQSLDRVDQAEAFYAKARAIDDVVYGDSSAIRGLDLVAKGSLELRRDRPREAAALFREAAPLLKDDEGNPTRDYFIARENLAVALETLGEADEALEIHEELMGDATLRDPYWAAERIRRGVNRAAALRTAGRFDDARASFERVVAESVDRNGEKHPQTAAIRVHQVAVEAAAGQYEQAAKRLATMLSASNGALETMLRVGSEGDKLAFLRERWRETSIAVTLALDTRTSTPATIKTAAEFVLNRKGRVAEAVTRQIGDTGSLGESGAARLTELVALRRSIAEATLLGRASDNVVAAKSTRLRELESELSRGAPDVGVVRGSSDVAARLHDGEVYVEYVRYRPMRAEMARQSDRWGPPRYAAFVLKPDGTLAVHGLGAAKDIDAQVSTLRTALSKRAAYDVAARNLHQAPWAPLSGDIGSAGRVYLVPDGALSLLPFEVLMDGAGEHLVKSRAFDYLATGRDLLRQSTSQPSDVRLLYAAVDFGLASTRRDGLLGSVTFNPLPGTATEAAAIRDVAPETKMVTGMAATKASLVSVDSPQTLHVATHGFFVASGEGASSEGARGLDYEVPSAARKMAPPQNPLLRAGIALAGANEDPAKGVLTAMEASSLDLHGTKLVTLSACETGVGEATDGEGVQGMRRSLGIAGAETVVMSLWKVDDAATATLMGEYYSRLARGESRVDALRASALVLAAKPETSHPYYWAAFIASGDPRSLTGTWVAPSAGSDANKAGPPPHRGCGVDTDAKDGALAALLLACVGVVRRRRRHARGDARV